MVGCGKWVCVKCEVGSGKWLWMVGWVMPIIDVMWWWCGSYWFRLGVMEVVKLVEAMEVIEAMEIPEMTKMTEMLLVLILLSPIILCIYRP